MTGKIIKFRSFARIIFSTLQEKHIYTRARKSISQESIRINFLYVRCVKIDLTERKMKRKRKKNPENWTRSYLAAPRSRWILDDVVDDVGGRQPRRRRGAEQREAERAAGVAAAQGDQQLLLSHRGTLILSLTSSLSSAPVRHAFLLPSSVPHSHSHSRSHSRGRSEGSFGPPRCSSATTTTTYLLSLGGGALPPSARRTAKRSTAAFVLSRSHSTPGREGGRGTICRFVGGGDWDDRDEGDGSGKSGYIIFRVPMIRETPRAKRERKRGRCVYRKQISPRLAGKYLATDWTNTMAPLSRKPLPVLHLRSEASCESSRHLLMIRVN